MKKSILDEINSLFETGEIQTIKFSKTGKTTVKYVKEPKLIQYSKCDNILQVIKEHAELSKSLEKVEMKPKLKLTVAEIEKLNVIACEVGYKKQSAFHDWIDRVGFWLGGGKSFAPDECKSFA